MLDMRESRVGGICVHARPNRSGRPRRSPPPPAPTPATLKPAPSIHHLQASSNTVSRGVQLARLRLRNAFTPNPTSQVSPHAVPLPQPPHLQRQSQHPAIITCRHRAALSAGGDSWQGCNTLRAQGSGPPVQDVVGASHLIAWHAKLIVLCACSIWPLIGACMVAWSLLQHA